ncbi:MAG: hypothetical protein AAF518_29170, partial [Spirochaetota bacterium]
MNTKKEIGKEIEKLLSTGKYILYYETIKQSKLSDEKVKKIEENIDYQNFKNSVSGLNAVYQQWYTKSLNLIKKIIPDRYDEFVTLYSI